MKSKQKNEKKMGFGFCFWGLTVLRFGFVGFIGNRITLFFVLSSGADRRNQLYRLMFPYLDHVWCRIQGRQ